MLQINCLGEISLYLSKNEPFYIVKPKIGEYMLYVSNKAFHLNEKEASKLINEKTSVKKVIKKK